jgi:hypothetical protein
MIYAMPLLWWTQPRCRSLGPQALRKPLTIHPDPDVKPLSGLKFSNYRAYQLSAMPDLTDRNEQGLSMVPHLSTTPEVTYQTGPIIAFWATSQWRPIFLAGIGSISGLDNTLQASSLNSRSFGKHQAGDSLLHHHTWPQKFIQASPLASSKIFLCCWLDCGLVRIVEAGVHEQLWLWRSACRATKWYSIPLLTSNDKQIWAPLDRRLKCCLVSHLQY